LGWAIKHNGALFKPNDAIGKLPREVNLMQAYDGGQSIRLADIMKRLQ
jgi:hypothetical protein